MSDFTIQQGTDASYSWPLTNDDGSVFNPAGWKAKMDVRSRYGNLLHSFSSDTSNLNFGNGELVAIWTSAETSLWNWSGGNYDLYLYNNGSKLRIGAGYISVSKEITTVV